MERAGTANISIPVHAPGATWSTTATFVTKSYRSPGHGTVRHTSFTVGASFGAYHAACFGFRHPHQVNRIIGLSGLYDMKRLTGGYSDANVYACNPFDFMRHEHDPDRLDAFRRQDIIFAIGHDDPSCDNNREFSTVLWEKAIGNALRIWDGWAHDWPYWERMIRQYIGGHD